MQNPLTKRQTYYYHFLCNGFSRKEVCNITGKKITTINTLVKHSIKRSGFDSVGEVKFNAGINGWVKKMDKLEKQKYKQMAKVKPSTSHGKKK